MYKITYQGKEVRFNHIQEIYSWAYVNMRLDIYGAEHADQAIRVLQHCIDNPN